MDKYQRRKIYGIREPKEPADQDVVARRHIHEAMVRWELKWLNSLHFITFLLAIVIVLAPAISKRWREIIEAIPAVSWIFQEFSNLRFWPIFFLMIGLIFHFYSMSKIDGKNYSEHGYPINLPHVRAPYQIIEAELYPRTKLEERVFWLDSLGGVLSALISWFTMFGAIAFFITKGMK